jgi:hypothetical protein
LGTGLRLWFLLASPFSTLDATKLGLDLSKVEVLLFE